MNIICICGKAQHGKDTTALFLRDYLENQGKTVRICHYGDLLKYICREFFDWNGEKDEAGRSLLQRVGTDIFRQKAPNFWVLTLKQVLKTIDGWDYVLIPDCRFPNEIVEMRDAGRVTSVRVIRPNFDNGLSEEQQSHPSETALNDFRTNYEVMNDGDMLDLLRKARVLGATLMENEVRV